MGELANRQVEVGDKKGDLAARGECLDRIVVDEPAKPRTPHCQGELQGSSGAVVIVRVLLQEHQHYSFYVYLGSWHRPNPPPSEAVNTIQLSPRS